MRHLLMLSLLLSLPLHAGAAIERPLDPVYIEGGQYTATLQARSQRWRLVPLDGTDVEVHSAAPCPHSTLPARGLWLIGRGADGGAELVAVSATPLPADHSGRIPLRGCNDPALRNGSADGLGVPEPLLDALLAGSGALFVED